mmetsp:Transcript_123516/g.384493  ORF Transcript_123516/g.384493 Transcript_123516/m.384493 type:complete len:239 (+) Transcript_123516:1369-2085(+)
MSSAISVLSKFDSTKRALARQRISSFMRFRMDSATSACVAKLSISRCLVSMNSWIWSVLVTVEITLLTMMPCTTAPTTMVKPTIKISASVPAAMSPKPTVVKTVNTKYMATSHCSNGPWLKREVPCWSTLRRPTQVTSGSSCSAAQRYQKQARKWMVSRRPLMKFTTRKTRSPLSHLHHGWVCSISFNLTKRVRRMSLPRREMRCMRAMRPTLLSPPLAWMIASTNSWGRQARRSMTK